MSRSGRFIRRGAAGAVRGKYPIRAVQTGRSGGLARAPRRRTPVRGAHDARLPLRDARGRGGSRGDAGSRFRRTALKPGLTEQQLDDHAVAPLAVELAVAAVEPDLAEAERPAEREARFVLGEDPAHELPVPAALALLDQRRERRPPQASSAVRARDIDREVADTRVYVACPIRVRRRPRRHGTAFIGDDERDAVLEPRRDVRGRARLRLERRQSVVDALVVDLRDPRGVRGRRRAGVHTRNVRPATSSPPTSSRWVSNAQPGSSPPIVWSPYRSRCQCVRSTQSDRHTSRSPGWYRRTVAIAVRVFAQCRLRSASA